MPKAVWGVGGLGVISDSGDEGLGKFPESLITP